MHQVKRLWLWWGVAMVLGCSAAEPAKNKMSPPKLSDSGAYPMPVPVEETLSGEEELVVEGPLVVGRPPTFTPMFQVSCEQVNQCTEVKIGEWRKTLTSVVKALQADFGPPVLKGVVRVQVGSGLGTGAQTVWRPTGGGPRLVRVLEVHFWKEERHILAHELFHALYQQDAFIKSLPDVIIEGSATYAEYRYRYVGKSQEEIAKSMQQQLKALGQTQPFGSAAYNGAFGVQPSDSKARLYIASGLLFMGLTERAAKQAIAALLERSARPNPIPLKTLEKVNQLVTLSLSPAVFAIAQTPPATGALQRFCELEGLLENSEGDREMRSFILQIMDEAKYLSWKVSHCTKPKPVTPNARRSPS